MRRAITLAGGGPACGLQIGALKRIAEEQIDFDIWALSCIGAWVGVIYNQFDKAEAPAKTEAFFRDKIFRNDRSYARFPINQVFAPDLLNNVGAATSFLADPRSYQDILMPRAMLEAVRSNLEFVFDPRRWSQGEFNLLVLENMAAHPFSRLMTSLLYLSHVNGLSRIYYPDSRFLESIDFDALTAPNKPFLYHNAWNLDQRRLELFANRLKPGFKKLTANSLCACSALPYIEETVELDGDTYCEGALVDTVNFKNLLQDFGKIDEVWILRIVAKSQIRQPVNLKDGLGNLCMLFAASVGEDDIKLFKYHAQEDGWDGKIIEIPVDASVGFDWNESNFDVGVEAGYRAADARIQKYREDEAAEAVPKRMGNGEGKPPAAAATSRSSPARAPS